MKKYDYVLVGAGLYSGVIAYLAGQAGKSCLCLLYTSDAADEL